MSKGIDILEFIPYGHENGITSRQLARRTGLTERGVRKCVHEARMHALVLNMQDGNGYFRPDEDDIEHVERWYNQENSRCREARKNMRLAKSFIKPAD